MRIFALVCTLSVVVAACDSKTDDIPLESDQPKRELSLKSGTQYAWSVRAVTSVGSGEWSPALEFSLHSSEAMALATAADQGNDIDFNPGVYSDSLAIPTVVSFSPAGAIVAESPTFKWEPVFDADKYEVRVIDIEKDTQVFVNSFSAVGLCNVDACEFDSNIGSSTLTTAQAVEEPDVGTSGTENTSGQEAEPQIAVVDLDIDVDPEVAVASAQTSSVQEQEIVPTDSEEEISTVEPELEVIEPSVAVVSTNSASPVVDEVVSPGTNTQSIDESETEVIPAEMEAVSSEITDSSVTAEIELLQSEEGVLAFPGAVGYAKYTVGGRGGNVLVVNTTLDIVDPNDDYLSLREAIQIESGPRTVVFSVGGIFDMGVDLVRFMGERGSNITVACQSAPAPGVIIKTYGFNVQSGAHDIVMRHCAIRGIDAGAPLGQAGRSMTVRGGANNILLDHMSLSWATDEGFQAYLAPDQTTGMENITVSNSIIAEGDADGSHPESLEHPEWGYHAMGPSCLNNNTSFRPTNCSIVNNFIAHNSSRNAMIWGGAGELSNNIVYNWYTLGLYAKPFSSNNADVIVRNNLMKSGPNTVGATSNPACGPAQYRCAMALGPSDGNGTARYSVANNYYISETKNVADAELIDNPNSVSPDGAPAFDAATPSDDDIRSMAEQGSRHMNCVGASRPERDAIDARVISEFFTGTGAIGIGDNIREGGHNVTKQRTWEIYGEPTSHPADYDTDNDGMPDEWEASNGLNPNDSSDHAGDTDGDGYTNIEEYLAIAAAC